MCVEVEKNCRKVQKTRVKRTDFSRTMNATLVTSAHGRTGCKRKG